MIKLQFYPCNIWSLKVHDSAITEMHLQLLQWYCLGTDFPPPVRFCLQKAQWKFPTTIYQNATSAEAVFTLPGVITQPCSSLSHPFIHVKSTKGRCSPCAKLLQWPHLSELDPMQIYFPIF